MTRTPLLLATLTLLSTLASAQEKPSSSESLRKQAEGVLKLDSTQARSKVGVVFEFAKRLEAEGKLKEAMRVLDRGLRIHAWALAEQLRYARLLEASGAKEKARTRAKLVFEHAERAQLVKGAAKLLGERLDQDIPLLTQPAGSATTLVLLPLNDPNAALLLRAMAPELARVSGVKVVVARVRLELPPPTRRPLQEELARVRASLEAQSSDPGVQAELKLQGKTLEDLAEDQELQNFVLRLYRRTRPSQVAPLEARFAALAEKQQWDGYALMDDVASAVRSVDRAKVCYVALTSKDICSSKTNFLFGARKWRHAVVSYHRFRAAFNGELPNRARLLNRTLKQCITSAGHVLGVKRCSQPTCVRAYPNSLQEHDAKKTKVCAECAAGFKRAREVGPPGPAPKLKVTPSPRMRPGSKIPQAELLALVKRLRDPNPTARATAAQALGKHGPAAGSAASDLATALSDSAPAVRASAAWALTRLQNAAKPALDPLLSALEDPVPQVRFHAVGALGAIGRDARKALPKLLRLLAQPQEKLRVRAAQAIALIQPEDESAIDPLLIALQDPNPTVQKHAAQALGFLGAKGKRAMKPLLRACATGDWMISSASLSSAARIDPTDPDVLEAARAILHGKKKPGTLLLRNSAIRVLGKLKPLARGAERLLLETIKDGEKLLRRTSCAALAELGSKTKPVLAALAAARKDDEDSVRKAAKEALERLAAP
jgi:HEAT repeat protein/predicted Zn-dependent protease